MYATCSSFEHQLVDDLIVGVRLARHALMDERDAELRGALRACVADVRADRSPTVQAERVAPTRMAMPSLDRRSCLLSVPSRVHEHLAVGQDAVDVEEQRAVMLRSSSVRSSQRSTAVSASPWSHLEQLHPPQVVEMHDAATPSAARHRRRRSTVILRCSMMFSASTASVVGGIDDRIARHDVAGGHARGRRCRAPCWRRRSPSVMMPSSASSASDDAGHAEPFAATSRRSRRASACRACTIGQLIAAVHQALRRASAACRACRPDAGWRSPPAGTPSRRAASSPARRRSPAPRWCSPSARGSADRLLRSRCNRARRPAAWASVDRGPPVIAISFAPEPPDRFEQPQAVSSVSPL